MVLWGAFYRASEGAEWLGCEGEWWPSVGELKYMVMAQGGMGIEWTVPVLGVEGLEDAWFPWRRQPEGALRSGDGQTGGGGASSGRRRRLPGGPLWAARLRSQLGWQNEIPPLKMKYLL
jgi:hypothetical protein